MTSCSQAQKLKLVFWGVITFLFFGLEARATEVEQIRIFVPPETSSFESVDLIDDVYDGQMRRVPEVTPVLTAVLQEKPSFAEIQARMEPSQYRSFLTTRSRLLKAAYWMLRPVSFNKEKLLERMNSIDEFVIQSADAIALSRRTGFVFSLSGAFGLGLSEKILDRIKNENLKKSIPSSGGFYFVAAGGLGVYFEQDLKGRNRLILDVFADGDFLKKIHTYAGEVSLAANWGVAVDRADVAGVDRLESHYVGILGVVRKSVSHFSYSLITGAAFPPYLPVGMVYTNETVRPRISILKIPLPKFGQFRCENLFPSGP